MNITKDASESLFGNITSIFSKDKPKHINLFGEDDIETGDNSSLLGKIKSNFTETIEIQTSYKSFFVVLSIGLIFIFLSLIFLPLVAISPQRFLTLFSLGSMIIISSFIFIYGTSEYIKMLCNRERFIFTFVYVCSLLLGIYSAYVKNLYLLSLISVLIQVITLIIFTLSFIPGGKSGISFILTMISSPIKNVFNRN